MGTKLIKVYASSWILTVCLASSLAQAQAPDVIVYNGKIFTSSAEQLWVEALAIPALRVSAIGMNDLIRQMAGPMNPFQNIQSAVLHIENPPEALTREQAVIAYTAGSAYAEMAEKQKGTLVPGMLADLAVWVRTSSQSRWTNFRQCVAC